MWGMTTWTLHNRAREHVLAAKKHLADSAFGERYEEAHPTVDVMISFDIFHHTRDALRLRIEEAITIQRMRPVLNRCLEDMGTGFLI